MIFTLLKGFLSLLGLANWAEKMWGDHELKEQGKSDLISQERKEILDDTQKAKTFEDIVVSDAAAFERMRDIINKQE